MSTKTAPTTEFQSTQSRDRRLGHDNSGEDPTAIAEQLSNPKDLNRIIWDVEHGNGEVRDIARFTRNNRNLIMNFGRLTVGQGIQDVTVSNPEMLHRVIGTAAGNFASSIQDTGSRMQRSAGYNFAVNASGFRDAGLNWATNLDEDLGRWLQVPGSGIDSLIQQSPRADGRIRQLLAEYTHENPVDMVWYLAERSLKSENWQRERYTREMVVAKRNASRLMLSMAQRYNLPSEHLNRSLHQLDRTDFSAFDHLTEGVTLYDQGALGDYIPTTLRVEVKFEGSPNNPQLPTNPLPTLQHEIFHATSAQDTDGRIGLRAVNMQGSTPNEAMTELLAHLSMGSVLSRQDGTRVLPNNIAYPTGTISMLRVMVNHERAFQSLYHAYYGNVPSKIDLQNALTTFYNNQG